MAPWQYLIPGPAMPDRLRPASHGFLPFRQRLSSRMIERFWSSARQVRLTSPWAIFRACLAGLNLKSWSSLTSTPASRLRRMTLRACRSMIVGQLKSWEPCLTVGTQAGGCLRKRNSAKQALTNTPLFSPDQVAEALLGFDSAWMIPEHHIL